MAELAPDERPLEKLQQQVLDVIQLGKGDELAKIAVLYAILNNAPDDIRARLLEYAARNFGEERSADAVPLEIPATLQSLDVLERRYSEVVDSMFNSLIQENLDPLNFYERLWSIVTNPFLPDESARVFALLWMFKDRCVPYFKVEPGLRMSNDDYRKRVAALRTQRQQIRFLLSRPIEQRTERADLVLRLIRSQHDEVDQVVSLTFVFSHYDLQIRRLQEAAIKGDAR